MEIGIGLELLHEVYAVLHHFRLRYQLPDYLCYRHDGGHVLDLEGLINLYILRATAACVRSRGQLRVHSIRLQLELLTDVFN